MLSQTDFDRYTLSDRNDPYYNDIPVLNLRDIESLDKDLSMPPFVSIFISTYNRQAQLQRTLETLARQDYPYFEVLLVDDGSTQDITSVIQPFIELGMDISYFRRERGLWTSCPSAAYKYAMSFAQGEVYMVMHPEMMLSYDAVGFVARAFLNDPIDLKKLDNCHYYSLDKNLSQEKLDYCEPIWRWVSLRPSFLTGETYRYLNSIDWHSDFRNLLVDIPNFNDIGGFAGRNNHFHATNEEYPWWFVGAAHKDSPIWEDMQITRSHGVIDMWFVTYRQMNSFVDIVPQTVMCLHQPHQTSAVGFNETPPANRSERRDK